MPTDLAAAIGRRTAEDVSAAQDEKLALLLPALFGFISVLLAVRSPAVAAALILVGLQ
jgi:hypothetical protein